MELIPLGRTDDIGASALYLNLDGTGILLDAGQDPNLDGPEGLPALALVDHPDRPLDHVIVTHAHHDHVGALPVVVERFPHVSVHMTRPTRMLLDVVLPASARLQRRRILEGSATGAPTFSQDQAEALSFLYQGHSLGSPFPLPGIRGGPDVKATLYHAGHILGSAGVLLEAGTGERVRRIFYTSDTCLRPQTILPGARFPEKPVDTLVMESTLGSDPEAETIRRKELERELGEHIKRVLASGGTVLLPVFALGRAQEIIALVDRFKSQGVIPEETPVYTSGSIRVVADLYDRTRYTSPRRDPDFEVFGVAQKRLPRSSSRENAALSEASIHIAASGMMFEKSLSNRLASKLLGGKRNAILFVGFLKEDTPGYRLLEASRNGPGATVKLDRAKDEQEIKCEVASFRLTGHSHRRELIQVVKKLRPRKVILVHGEQKARNWMADNISYFYPDTSIELPEEATPTCI